jgi:hypothetical protein
MDRKLPTGGAMSTTTIVLVAVIVALFVPYLMRRRTRLGRAK